MAAFIHQGQVGHPYEPMFTFGGDDRGYSCCSGSSRIFGVAQPVNTATSDGQWAWGLPSGTPGLTQMYDIATSLDGPPWNMYSHITQAAKDDWEWGSPLKVAWGESVTTTGGCHTPERLGQQFGEWTSSERMYCWISGNNPFVAGSPYIDLQFTFTVTWGSGGFSYDIEGDSDGFPSYEIYINNQLIDGRWGSDNPDDLFDPLEVHWHSSGWIGG